MRKTKSLPEHLYFVILVALPLILVSSGFSQQDSAEELVTKVAERMSSFPEVKDYEAEVSSMIINVDKNWKAKKTTLVEKIVRVKDGVREEDILSAVETKSGKKKDVTQEQRDDTRKRQEKARKKRAKRLSKGEDVSEDGDGRRDLTLEEMFPFGEESRENYTFKQLENESLAGKTVLVLETRSKIRSDKAYEGTFYIDPDNYEVLRVSIKPAKNPSRVKKFEMELFFQVLPEGYYVPKESRVRIDVGLVVKSIRMEIQEVYKSYTIL